MIPSMRGTAIAMLALAWSAIALAGCGGASHTSSIGAPVGAEEPISGAQAVAYAHAVNLRPADLPGMSVLSPEGATPVSGPLEGEAARCAGAVNPHLMVAKIRSANFSGRAHELIQSTVVVWPNSALAAREQVVGRSQRALLCAQRLVSREFARRSGPTFRSGRVKISRLGSLPGVPGSSGVRIEIPILGAHPVNDYVDAVKFVYGRSAVTLLATGVLRPVATATERRLLSLLYTRAKTYVETRRNLDQARDLLRKYLQSNLTPNDPTREEAQKLLQRASGA